jgi:hypothetical protein
VPPQFLQEREEEEEEEEEEESIDLSTYLYTPKPLATQWV